MKDAIGGITKEPEAIQFLASGILMAKMRGQKMVTLLELSNEEIDWLQENGFEVNYNKRIYEWEIKL